MTDTTSYLFDTGTELGRDHMDHLAHLLDPSTFALLGPTGVRPGWRCLDLGAGGGSVSRWLADRVGPTGEVVALDLDTAQLPEHPSITVVQHDINDGLTGHLAGPYDLVHARLTLMHLPRREEILAMLVSQLAPGGWLVVGDVSDRPCTVLCARSEQDVAVWEKIQHLSHRVVGPLGGLDVDWAPRIHAAMVAAGLTDIHGTETSQTVTGGTPGMLLHALLNEQAHEPLVAAGATREEMTRYQELCRDPQFRSWFYQVVFLRGRKPS